MRAQPKAWTLAAAFPIMGCLIAVSILGLAPGTTRAQAPSPVFLESQEYPGKIENVIPCPAAPYLIAFQRTVDLTHLEVVDTRSGEVFNIKSTDDEFSEGLLGSVRSYDGQLDWMAEGEGGKFWITFVGDGNYENKDIYITYVGAGRAWRLTKAVEVEDSPRFSPDGKQIVCVSGRSGKGDLYLIDKVDEIRSQILKGVDPVAGDGITQLTNNPDQDLHPAWDPTGRFVAFSEMKVGDDEYATEPNYGISVLDVKNGGDAARLTRDKEQETRPTWSQDGNRIAYYYSERASDQRVNVGVVWVVYGSKSKRPVQGRSVTTGVGLQVAVNVVPNPYRGPSWGARASGAHSKTLMYVRFDENDAKAVAVADIEMWETGQPGYETILDMGEVTNPSDVTWSFEQTVLASGQSGLTYGIYSFTGPPALTAVRGEFDYAEVEEAGGGGPWKWVAGGVALLAAGAVAVVAGGGGDGGGGPEPLGDPPAPPASKISFGGSP